LSVRVALQRTPHFRLGRLEHDVDAVGRHTVAGQHAPVDESARQELQRREHDLRALDQECRHVGAVQSGRLGAHAVAGQRQIADVELALAGLELDALRDGVLRADQRRAGLDHERPALRERHGLPGEDFAVDAAAPVETVFAQGRRGRIHRRRHARSFAFGRGERRVVRGSARAAHGVS
jgi:hypothetical protein